jgi:hypothetical protein
MFAVTPALANTMKTIDTAGGPGVRINEALFFTYRFVPNHPIFVPSGATILLIDSSDDGHTLTLVVKSDLPKHVGDVLSCGPPGSVCFPALAAHFPQGPPPGLPTICDPNASTPCIPYVQAGTPCGTVPSCTGPYPISTPYNIDSSGNVVSGGDSVVILPGQTIQLKITAQPGTVLHYMCVFHAWMQGEIIVVGGNSGTS